MDISIILNDVEKYINSKVEYPNAGGCAKIAGLISNRLDILHIPYRFHLYNVTFIEKCSRKTICDHSLSESAVNSLLADLNTYKKYYIVATHIWISVFDEVENYYIPVNKNQRKEQYTIQDIDILQSLKKNIKNSYMAKGTWNPIYNRNQNEKIRKAIYRKFKNIKDETE